MKRAKQRQVPAQSEPCGVYFPDDYDYDADDESDICEACSGTGGDPYNDGCLPCEYCDGEGYKWWQ